MASGYCQSMTNFQGVLKISVLTNPISGKLTTNFIVASDAGAYLQAMLFYSVQDFTNIYGSITAGFLAGSNFSIAGTNLYKFLGITSPATTNATTSTNYVLLNSGLSNIVTNAGKYDISFKCTFFGGAANDIGFFSIHTNGVRVDDSEVMAGGVNLLPVPTFTSIIATTNTRIEIYYRAAGADTINAINPSLEIEQTP